MLLIHTRVAQVDLESEEFKLRNPSGMSTGGRRKKGRGDDDGSDDDLVDTAFTPVDEAERDERFEVSSDGGDDDDTAIGATPSLRTPVPARPASD
eukprot:17828-Eustigmatos_ZCMA.PRE.1